MDEVREQVTVRLRQDRVHADHCRDAMAGPWVADRVDRTVTLDGRCRVCRVDVVHLWSAGSW